jgi:signal transduction histidine kinase
LARKIILFFDLEQLRRADTKDPVVVCRGRADAAAAAGAVRAGGEERRASDVVVHCDPGSVALNEEYLAHAVAELVGNGLRFSAPGRTVEVRGFVRGDRYRVEVADQGIGMTAEERARVAPFTQFGRAEREQQGLGLGLAIARDTMEMAGGTFALEAGPGGIGLRAVLELPLQGETRAAIAS